jgi:hypothetical protein
MLERKNAHEQATQRNEQGALGRWLGSKSEKAGNISFIVIIVCFLFIGIAFLRVDIKAEFDSFMKFCAALFAIITGALGYLFGSSHQSKAD